MPSRMNWPCVYVALTSKGTAARLYKYVVTAASEVAAVCLTSPTIWLVVVDSRALRALVSNTWSSLSRYSAVLISSGLRLT